MKPTALLPLLSLPLAFSAPTIEHSLVRRANTNVNQLIAAFLKIFPLLNIAVTEIGEGITDIQQDLADSFDIDTVEDDLSSGSALTSCADVTLLFARGTLEPGTLGTLVGPPFVQALEQQLGRLGKTLAVEGTTNYAATIGGYLTGGDRFGSAQM